MRGLWWGLWALAALPGVAGAAPARPPRESAWLAPAGSGSVGVFNPLRWALTDALTLEAHPLAFFAAPHVGLDWQVAQGELGGRAWAATARFGLSVPSWALRFGLPFGARGYLSPTCAVADTGEARADTCAEAGWAIAPSVGGRWTWGREGLLTVDGDLAVGLLLTGERPASLDTYAPLQLAVAPLTHTWRAHVGVRTEHAVRPWLRLAAEVDLYRVGDVGPLSPWTVSGWLGVDWPLTPGFALTSGVIWFNSDQGAIDLVADGGGFVRVERVRSNDVYPTLDALWTW